MKVVWDEAKNKANRKKHRVSFEEASALFTGGVDYLEIFDEEHSVDEDRFIAVGPILRDLVLAVYMGARRGDRADPQREVGDQTRARSVPDAGRRRRAMTKIPELTDEQMSRAIPARVRKRLMEGKIESGDDVASLRRFVGLSQPQFAQAMGISVHTLRNWEQGRRHPEGPAIGLLRIAARHPRIIRENVKSAA